MLVAKLNIEGRLLQVVPLRHCGLLQQDRHHKMYDLQNVYAKLVKGGSLVSAQQLNSAYT